MMVSSKFETTSISWRRASSTSASMPAGMSRVSHSSPMSEDQTRAFSLSRSTTPLNSDSTPIGSWITAGSASRRSRIICTVRSKSAPMRSILLTKQMRGTLYLLAWRHTVSVWGSTPATASNTATAPSSTRSERSTSTVKSTWPGVSMMLIQLSRHEHVVAAEVMVMPRSCSWTIQSMVAAPSCTSPIL